MADEVITANSYPDYNSIGLGSSWSCSDWITWHKLLKDAIGKDRADSLWVKAWEGQSSFANNYNWCKYDSTWNDYVKSEKLSVTNLISDAVVGGKKIGENVLGGVVNASNIFKWALPILILAAILFVIFYFVKKYKLISV
ncbi:MAG: hypothetical protein IT243_06065 [Bacteroidia bacterium]|nr:hypothetical protein [Bacteroidia bacterium]